MPNNNTVKTTKTNSPMEALLKKYSIIPPRKGQEIDAKIVSLSKRGILFDIGWKSHAVLGDREIQDLSPFLSYLKVDDVVKAKVVVEESKEGYPVVSMRRFFDKGRWDIIEEKFKKEQEIDVVAGEYGKGGVFIDFMGIRGVIPKIQLTEDYVENAAKLIGQKIKVKVLEVDREKNRLVVSQKAFVLGISYKSTKQKFDKINIGKIYTAKVIGFSEFGVFCEVNKIEGLIHISEISWNKVSDPAKHLHVGDKIDVMVVEKNEANLKLNLSIKRLAKDPWDNIEKRYPKETQFEGEVVRIENYGYIVRLEPGVEGLIHISKLPENGKLEIGSKVPVYIEKVDSKSRRISLILVSHVKPVVYR